MTETLSLNWTTKPQDVKVASSIHRHWHTDCKTYRVTHIMTKSGDDNLFAACKVNDQKNYEPLEFKPPHTSHPLYYESLREAFTAAEQYHADANFADCCLSNSEDILRGVANLEQTEYKEAPPAKSGRSNKTSAGEKPTVSVKGEAVKLQETKVRKLFTSLGFPAEKWSVSKLTVKANQLPSLAPDAEEPKSEEDLLTFRRISDALAEENIVEVVEENGNEEEAPPAPKRRGRPPKNRTQEAPVSSNGHHKKEEEEKQVRREVEREEISPEETPWVEARSKLVSLDEKLADRFFEMDRYPRDRNIQKNRLKFLRNEFLAGRFRGCEWASVKVKETGQTYRINGKHTSQIAHDLYQEGISFPDVQVLVREYECNNMEDAAKLFATFDAKQSARSKGDVIRGFAVAHEVTADFKPRLLSVLTAAIALVTKGDAYRKMSPAEQAGLLLENLEFAQFVKDLLAVKGDVKHMVRMSVLAAMLQTWQKDENAAEKFWVDVRDDVDGKGVPQRVIREFLIGAKVGAGEGERVGEREVLVKCLQAWNAWRAKEKTVRLKYAKNTEVPEIS